MRVKYEIVFPEKDVFKKSLIKIGGGEIPR